VYATSLRVAAILGAKVVVVAIDRLTRNAKPPCTIVVFGTGVTVIASLVVVDVDARTGIHIATIGSADVVIAAVKKQRARYALPGLAVVIERALIAVVAGQVIWLVHATQFGIAVVIGAEITVVLALGGNALADRIHTGVVDSAGIAIFAGTGEFFEGASQCGQATVCGAGVAVFAVDFRADAHAVEAVVGVGALVAVVALSLDGIVDAAQFSVALVKGAGIAVFAGHALAQAFSAGATVLGGAIISIVAGLAVRCGLFHALTGFRVATHQQAGIVRLLAFDDRASVQHAVAALAEEGAIAEVPIFLVLAVSIESAFADKFTAHTLALNALVTFRAVGSVVAFPFHELEIAAGRGLAEVLCAGVVVGAVPLLSLIAFTVGAGISDGTGIIVVAAHF